MISETLEKAEKEILKNIPAEIENREEIAFWSLGRPGWMRKLAADKNFSAIRKGWEKDLKILRQGNLDEKFKLAEEMAKDIGESAGKMEFWQAALRENILGEKGETNNPQRELALIEKIGASLKLLQETNSNPRLVLENLFIQY